MQLSLSLRARPLPARLDLDLLDVSAVSVIATAAAIRTVLIALGWPELNSDEATNGLIALHLANHGDLPIYVYGQAYVGALEAYMAAPLFLLFGVSDFALRFGQIILCSLFLGALYLLARLLYDRKVALVSITILSLGTLEMLFRQLEASGGYMEMLVFGTVSLLLASWLVLSAATRTELQASSVGPASRGRPPASQKRYLGYGALGLAWGLGFWSHFIVLFLILASAALLLAFLRDELRTRASLWLLAGLLAGLLPVILHDISTFPNQTAVGTLFQLYAAGGTGATHGAASLGQRLAGALLVGFPIFTGARPVCALPPQEAWPLSPHAGAHTVLCSAIHGVWSGGFITLWLVAATGAILALRRWRTLRPGPGETSGATAIQGCRLAVLGSAGLTTVLYMVSAAPAISPRYSSRYLLLLWVAVPCLVAILLTPTGRGVATRILAFGRAGIIAAFICLLALGTVDTFHQVSYVQWKTGEQNALIRNLERIGAARVYTDYWTCYRMIYQSRERVLCGVLDNHRRPAENRYPTYLDIVRRDRAAAYVLPLRTSYAAAIMQRMAHSGRHFRRYVFNSYVVFQPISTG
jgi:hypothetical protein